MSYRDSDGELRWKFDIYVRPKWILIMIKTVYDSKIINGNTRRYNSIQILKNGDEHSIWDITRVNQELSYNERSHDICICCVRRSCEFRKQRSPEHSILIIWYNINGITIQYDNSRYNSVWKNKIFVGYAGKWVYKGKGKVALFIRDNPISYLSWSL